MRKRLPTRKCLGEFCSFEGFPSASHRLQGNVGLSCTYGHLCAFPIPMGAENVCCGEASGLHGVRLAFDAGEVWHLAREKRGAEVFLSHHRGNPRWRPFMSKDHPPPSCFRLHLPRFPCYNHPCRQRCVSCKLEKPGTLNLDSVLIKFSCKIQVQFPYL